MSCWEDSVLAGKCCLVNASWFIPAHHPITTQIRFITPVNLWLGLLHLKLDSRVLPLPLIAPKPWPIIAGRTVWCSSRNIPKGSQSRQLFPCLTGPFWLKSPCADASFYESPPTMSPKCLPVSLSPKETTKSITWLCVCIFVFPSACFSSCPPTPPPPPPLLSWPSTRGSFQMTGVLLDTL